MLSFHNDADVKQKYVDRLTEHHRLDQIIQGTGYDGSRGCMVGCTLNNYSHEAYPDELGLPEWYAHLCDQIFEGLPKDKAPEFAMAGLTAIPVGVSIESVKWKLAVLRHKRDLERLESNTEPYAQQCRDSINSVISYCETELAGTASESEWSAAESARSAAESAAESAWSAAWSAEAAAWSAAWSAVRSAVAKKNHYEWEAETLIRLICELKND